MAPAAAVRVELRARPPASPWEFVDGFASDILSVSRNDGDIDGLLLCAVARVVYVQRASPPLRDFLRLRLLAVVPSSLCGLTSP